MNITERQVLEQLLLRRMVKGAGGQKNFDLILYLVETDPSFAEELGKVIYTRVREMEDQAIAEDENDAFAREMNDVARAKGLNLDDPRNGMLVS